MIFTDLIFIHDRKGGLSCIENGRTLYRVLTYIWLGIVAPAAHAFSAVELGQNFGIIKLGLCHIISDHYKWVFIMTPCLFRVCIEDFCWMWFFREFWGILTYFQIIREISVKSKCFLPQAAYGLICIGFLLNFQKQIMISASLGFWPDLHSFPAKFLLKKHWFPPPAASSLICIDFPINLTEKQWVPASSGLICINFLLNFFKKRMISDSSSFWLDLHWWTLNFC